MSHLVVRKHAKSVRKFISKLTIGNRPIFPHDLGGACAVASYTLCCKLQQQNIPAVFWMGRFTPTNFQDLYGAHCWAQVDQTVIDVTATQFNGNLPHQLPEVFIKPRHAYDQIFTKHMHNVCHGKEAFEYVKDWDDQSPVFWNDEILRFLDKSS